MGDQRANNMYAPDITRSIQSRFPEALPHGNYSRTKEEILHLRSATSETTVEASLIQNLPRGRLNRRETTFGEQVTFLQAALLELNLMNPSAVRFARGNYGPRTTAAVSSIQSSAGLPATGVYDEAVRAELVKMLTTHRSQRSQRSDAKSSASRPLALQPGDTTATLHYTSSAKPEGPPVPHRTIIKDARPLQEAGALSYETHGFSVVKKPTALTPHDFYHNTALLESVYYAETKELLKEKLGADRVFIIASQVRNNTRKSPNELNPFADNNPIASYASVVHTDFCASKSVQKFYRTSGLPSGAKVRYQLVNTWRNISEKDPVYNDALACCDTTSVTNEEFLRFDEPLNARAAPGRPGDWAQQYRLTADNAANHRWFYYPHMSKDEVLLFKQFDSDPQKSSRFTFHSAFHDPTIAGDLPARESVEICALAIFIEPEGGTPGRDVLSRRIEFHRQAAYTLQSRLAARASRGLLDPREAAALADTAALNDIPDEYVLQRLRQDTEWQGYSNSQGLPQGHICRGSYGQEVRQLQFALIEAGVLDSNATRGMGAGRYGPMTTAAVAAIQCTLGVAATGDYDEAVKGHLMKMLSAQPVVSAA